METIRKNLSNRQDILQKTKKQRVDAKSELDEVLESLRLAREWNRDIKHEVAVSRRSAHKVEDIVRDLEKSKKSQDLLLDQLSEQIRSVSSNVAILTEELDAQRQQTTDTKEALMVTKDELDRLTSEKKQLVQQWTSSILARTRREKALSECMRAYQEKQDTLTEAMREISLLRVEFTSVKDETHGFVLNRNRLENEVKYVQMEIEKLGGNVENTAREFEMLQKTIALSQERQAKMNQLKNKIDAEIASTTHKMDLVLKERQKLESR
jgi:chromosome segregation ATPase